ncbi:MAG: hypothetical protein LBJ81_01950 [Puniceicoccales bacterium]|nr:hypothetical protein [Puniceicoccales bacterium]
MEYFHGTADDLQTFSPLTILLLPQYRKWLSERGKSPRSFQLLEKQFIAFARFARGFCPGPRHAIRLKKHNFSLDFSSKILGYILDFGASSSVG